MKKRLFAALLALLLVVSSMPLAAAELVHTYDVPEGYDEGDYYVALAFMETEDENGVKNGEKFRDDYDPEDPETWYYITEDEEGFGIFFDSDPETWYETGAQGLISDRAHGVRDDEGIKYLSVVCFWDLDLVGNADFSEAKYCMLLVCSGTRITEIHAPAMTEDFGCQYNDLLTEVDLSRCTDYLGGIYCDTNCSLSRLDLSNNLAAQVIYANDCALTEILLPESDVLSYLNVDNNMLTDLDLSKCTGLSSVSCMENPLTEIDLTSNKLIEIDRVSAEGNGTVGINHDVPYVALLLAQPADGEEFLGWYNGEDELLSSEAMFDYTDLYGKENVFIARFSGGQEPLVPGDVNNSGEVEVADAIMTLRAAMGILQLSDEQLAAADVNESGEIEVADAIIILRMAMGLIS